MSHTRKLLLTIALTTFAIFTAPSLVLAQRGGGLGREAPPRTSPQFLKAFHGSVSEASQSTVRILCDDKEVALGTVVGADGWIVTKYSELTGKPVCKLGSGTKLDARIVGIQEAFDIALLKVETTGLKAVAFADSKLASVGNWVVSVGPGEEPVAVGVMSVAARTPPPAPSRGPSRPGMTPSPQDLLGIVVVYDGTMARVVRVIGQGPGAKAGIKIDDQILSVGGKDVTDQGSLIAALASLKVGDSVEIKIMRDGDEQDLHAKLETPRAPDTLGISVAVEGATTKVAQVAPRSAAEQADIRKGDQIVSVGGSAIHDQESLLSLLGKMKPGDSLMVKVVREGKTLELKAKLQARGPRGRRGGQDQNQMGSVLSEKRAGFPTFFQSDTVIKPHDCGGPVCDLDGHVLGINIARAGRVESYSIPSFSITSMLPDLKSGKLSPELVALRKKIVDLKAQVKRAASERLASEKTQPEANAAADSTALASDSLSKRLQEAEAVLEKAEKSLSVKKGNT
jgi:S1-C subfamily serine protease